MGVTITKGGKPVCPYCGGTGIRTHTVVCQGKSAEMRLPCLVCKPYVTHTLPYLGLQLAAKKPHP